jgi:ApbE superfamily uncharacterized protein (UPF0280 family)
VYARVRQGQLKALMTTPSDYSNRDEYRCQVASDLICWRTQYKETELYICADCLLEQEANDAVVSLRQILDHYILHHESFAKSFVPVRAASDAPSVIADMCSGAMSAGVGPMAAVAGAFAAHVGQALLEHTSQVIVENGGDVFIKTKKQRTVAIFAGKSPVSMKIGIAIDTSERAISVCTSSGTVGHSFSFGKADAAVVVSHDACLADACATRLGNDIKHVSDIQNALETIYGIDGVLGAVAVMGGTCGAIGNIHLTPL